MIDRVAAFARRYNLFSAGARIGVAVSGGADSVCLLSLLRELELRLELSVIHINHQLRGEESEADERFVHDLAAGFGLRCISERRPVDASEPGNLEQAAREARRSVFRREIEAGRVDRIALAHTLSDQAETVLFRFLRGSYITGLAGMRPVTPDGLVRPLLEIERRDVVGYLQTRGLAWREDRSNQDPRFARNRIRHHWLPELTAAWNPNLPTLLAQHASLAQEDADYWDTEVDRLASALLATSTEGVTADVQEIRKLPAALARRLIRKAFQLVKGDLREIDFPHIHAVLELFEKPSGHFRTQVPGVDVMRSFDQIRFRVPPSGPLERDFEVALRVPGVTAAPQLRTCLSLELVERQAGTGVVTGALHGTLKSDLDWHRIRSEAGICDSSGAEHLVLRNWRPGDAYQRVGDQHEHKLKTLFHEARIPLWERRDWPVVAAGSRIIWSREFGPVADSVPDASTTTILRIIEKNAPS